MEHIVFNLRTGSAMVYLFAVGSLIGFVAYIYALGHLSTSFVSLYAYVNPVVAVILGTLILHEPFGWRLVGSMGIILSGITIVTRKDGRRAEVCTGTVTFEFGWRDDSGAQNASPLRSASRHAWIEFHKPSSVPRMDAGTRAPACTRSSCHTYFFIQRSIAASAQLTTRRPLSSRTMNSTTASTSSTWMKLPMV